jgi:hypothetical protein
MPISEHSWPLWVQHRRIHDCDYSAVLVIVPPSGYDGGQPTNISMPLAKNRLAWLEFREIAG